MKIEIYKSALCPRCAYLIKKTKELQKEYGFEIETYDIATALPSFIENKITMIPTIKLNNIQRSWIIPKESEIKEFILENMNK